jgi:hypothetical protein
MKTPQKCSFFGINIRCDQQSEAKVDLYGFSCVRFMLGAESAVPRTVPLNYSRERGFTILLQGLSRASCSSRSAYTGQDRNHVSRLQGSTGSFRLFYFVQLWYRKLFFTVEWCVAYSNITECHCRVGRTLLRRSRVQISTRRPAFLTHFFHSFPSSLQANTGIFHIRPRPLPSTYFTIYFTVRRIILR